MHTTVDKMTASFIGKLNLTDLKLITYRKYAKMISVHFANHFSLKF